jgi:hypothetical protein
MQQPMYGRREWVRHIANQKKSKGKMAMHYKNNNCIPLTLIKKNQNLGKKTKTLVGQGLHKFVEAMVI